VYGRYPLWGLKRAVDRLPPYWQFIFMKLCFSLDGCREAIDVTFQLAITGLRVQIVYSLQFFCQIQKAACSMGTRFETPHQHANAIMTSRITGKRQWYMVHGIYSNYMMQLSY
jgi:hypothetical protein